MTDDPRATPTPKVRWWFLVVAVAVLGYVFLTHDTAFQDFTRAQIAQCKNKYDAARSASDSFRADNWTLPGYGKVRGKACRDYRLSGALGKAAT